MGTFRPTGIHRWYLAVWRGMLKLMLNPAMGIFFLSTIDFSTSFAYLSLRPYFLSLSPLVFTSSSCSFCLCSIFALPSSSFSSFSQFVLPLLLILLLLLLDLLILEVRTFYFFVLHTKKAGSQAVQRKLFESNRWLLWSKVMIWGSVPASCSSVLFRWISFRVSWYRVSSWAVLLALSFFFYFSVEES